MVLITRNRILKAAKTKAAENMQKQEEEEIKEPLIATKDDSKNEADRKHVGTSSRSRGHGKEDSRQRQNHRVVEGAATVGTITMTIATTILLAQALQEIWNEVHPAQCT